METLKSRYSLNALNKMILDAGGHLANEEVEIGTDIKIHHNEVSDDGKSVKITQYLTFRFGYWQPINVSALGEALGCPAIDIIEVIYEDDDVVRDRYHYKVPTSPFYHKIKKTKTKSLSKAERRMKALKDGILDWHDKL